MVAECSVINHFVHGEMPDLGKFVFCAEPRPIRINQLISFGL